MTATPLKSVGLNALLHQDNVRQTTSPDGNALYAAVDIVAMLTGPESAEALWEQIKRAEPALARQVHFAEFSVGETRPATRDALPLEGVLRLVQSIPSPRAERLKTWLAQSTRDRLIEAENPEMLALRARRLYEQKGYSRRWIDKRLRGVSARQEMTGEWYRRGINQGEQFRDLTNRLMRRGFGMDVERYRRYKSLTGTSQNLRDHMSDLELALVTLGETVAVALHQARGSNSFEQLTADSIDAGNVVARTRRQIERLSGRPVVQPGNHLTVSRMPPRRRSKRSAIGTNSHPGADALGSAELANRGRDMQNPSPSHPARSVA
jgi:DNA-damage-inducible protein D